MNLQEKLGQNVLFVGAHPDDIEMNAGGTISRLTLGGARVRAVVLASNTKINGVRMSETVRALRHLGVYHVDFNGGTDTRLDSELSVQIDRLDTLIKEVKPDTVFTHYHADTHQDHVAAHRITMAAARNVPNLLMYKPTYPSGRCDIPFQPNLLVRLSDLDMEAKACAIAEFKSQEVKYGHARWMESLKSTAAGDAWTYGGFHGYAELFQISRLAF